MQKKKCPKCNATIEKGVKICGNCKSQIVWNNGKPRLSTGEILKQTGCALTSLGCLLPILLFLVIIIYTLITS
jgi:predicted nucleic acid-binding Zn ribbon protein